MLWDPDFACGLGYAYVLGGRAADAVPLMERSIRETESIGQEGTLAFWMSWLGEAYVHVDRPADARQVASRALDLARERRQRGVQALCHRLEAEVTMRTDPPDPDAAERQYREALALATDLGMRPLVAHCHLGLGKLYSRAGDGVKVREYLTTAATMYREMDMGFWLAQAQAEMRELA